MASHPVCAPAVSCPTSDLMSVQGLSLMSESKTESPCFSALTKNILPTGQPVPCFPVSAASPFLYISADNPHVLDLILPILQVESWKQRTLEKWANHLSHPSGPSTGPTPTFDLCKEPGQASSRSNQGKLFLLFPPSWGCRSPDEALPEFLIWPLIYFCLLRGSRILVGIELTRSTSSRHQGLLRRHFFLEAFLHHPVPRFSKPLPASSLPSIFFT